MTQTLMDFLQMVAPAKQREGITTPTRRIDETRLDLAKGRMDGRLSRLNKQIAGMGTRGHLIAVPLCPSACEPGTLSDFVFSINTDPFQRWNMMIYADQPETADILDTLPYHPDYATDTDAVMIDYLMGLMAKRDADFAAQPDMSEQHRTDYNDTLRARLIEDCRQIERALFGARKRLWRVHEGRRARSGSPPNAAIKATMSSGNGAENRI